MEELDALTSYIVIPNRGLVFEREGTIFAHPQMKLMTAIITLDRLTYNNNFENDFCKRELNMVDQKFNKTMERYREITYAIFQAKNMFTSAEICTIFERPNRPEICQIHGMSNQSNALGREKRFVGIGAYAVAGTAIVIGTTALGLAGYNTHEIERINKYLIDQEQMILELQTQFKLTTNKLDVVLDTQNSVLSYIEEMTVKIEDIRSNVECWAKYFTYMQWANELISEVEKLLQFVFQGQTYGRLTPTLIKPSLLRQFIEDQTDSASEILGRYPNMLYQSAMASILNADFDNLQFTFLITYPDFGRDPIYPYFSVKQNGFWAQTPDSDHDTCLRYDMPSVAILYGTKLFALRRELHCPNFGNVKICPNTAFDMIPMNECIKLQHLDSDNRTSTEMDKFHCQLIQCPRPVKPDSYLTSPSGLLIRTQSPTVDIVYDKPRHQLDIYVSALMKTIATPPSGALFIAWQANISAVSFNKTVVYSPINAENHGHIAMSTSNEKAYLNMMSLFSIPSLGTERISEIINTQQQRIQELEKNFEPSFDSVKKWATDAFTFPSWLKFLIYAAFALTAVLMGKSCYHTISKFKTPEQRPPMPHTYDIVPDPTPANPLYPNLNYAPSNLPRPLPTAYYGNQQVTPSVPPRGN